MQIPLNTAEGLGVRQSSAALALHRAAFCHIQRHPIPS